MEVYFLSVVRPTRLVTPVMQRQKSGSIVNISSTAGVEPNPAFPTSSVFRAGLASFAKIFADEHAAENIRMNNVLPGFVDNFPVKDEILASIPMQRYAKVAEVGELVAFLASERVELHHRPESPHRRRDDAIALMRESRDATATTLSTSCASMRRRAWTLALSETPVDRFALSRAQAAEIEAARQLIRQPAAAPRQDSPPPTPLRPTSRTRADDPLPRRLSPFLPKQP